MSKTYVGDTPRILLNAGSDISSATILEIDYKKPDETTGTWTATLSGTNYLYYDTESGDIDQAGTWEFTAYIVLPSWSGHGDAVEYIVYDLPETFVGAIPTALEIKEYLEGYGITKDVISDKWIKNRRDNFVIPYIERVTRLNYSEEKEVTEYVSGNGKEILFLSRKPVNSITSINYVLGDEMDVDITSAIELDGSTGIIIKKSYIFEHDYYSVFVKGNMNLKVTYKYGYTDFVDSESNDIVDIKEAIIMMVAKQILIQIGARTGGGSVSVQSHSRNYGNRGKYTDLINELDINIYVILSKYMTGIVGI